MTDLVTFNFVANMVLSIIDGKEIIFFYWITQFFNLFFKSSNMSFASLPPSLIIKS